MENKCNKTPNNNKYLDHVYCHTSESKNYIRANHVSGNGAGGAGVPVAAGQDVMAILKENKQLKAMLILHLDLIQEQSDQLMAKDKVLNSLRDEAENLRSKNGQLEAQVQELQKQLQRQIKRVGLAGEVSTLPPPPLAKIQCKIESNADLVTRSFINDEFKSEKEENDIKKEITIKSAKKNYKIQESLSVLEKPSSGNGNNNIIGECNGKLISKIILHRVSTMGLRSPISTASDSASELELETNKKSGGPHKKDNITNMTTGDEIDYDDDDDGNDEEDDETEDSNDGKPLKNQRKQALSALSLTIPRGAKPRKPLPGSLTSTLSPKPRAVKVCITPPTPSRGGKQMPLMLSHAPEMHSDESVSCDSIGDAHQVNFKRNKTIFELLNLKVVRVC